MPFMFALRDLFTTPAFVDEDKAFVARLLYIILRALFALSLVFAIPFSILAPEMWWRYTIIAGVVAPTCLGLMALTRRGHTFPASLILVLVLWLTVTSDAFMGGGVHAPIIIGYVVTIVIAGLLINDRAGVITAVASILSGLVMAYTESRGLLPTLPITYSPYTYFVIIAFFLLTVMVLQQVASSTLRAALQKTSQQLNERLQVERKIQQNAEEMRTLYNLGVALSSSDDLYQVLRALVQELRQWMTADTFYIGLYDEQTDIISFPLYLTYDDDLQVPARNLGEKPGLTKEVLTQGKTLYIPDIAKPAEQARHNIVTIVDMGVRSYIGIPLVMKDRIIGLMSMQAREPNAYSEEQVRLLETLASQVAITVERLKLLAALQTELGERKRAESCLEQRMNENYFLYNIGVLLVSAPNLIEAMRALSAELGHLMPVDTFFLAFYDPATDVLSFPLFLRDGVEVTLSSWKMHDKPSLTSEVIVQRKTIYIEDVLDPNTQNQHPHVPIGEMKVHAWLGLPLVVQGQVVGVLSVQSQQPHAYTRPHIRLLEALAVQLNVTIERLRLLEALQSELTERAQAEQQAQRRAEQLATMNEISRAVSTLQDLDRVLEVIYRQIQRIASVDTFYISLYDQTQEQVSFPIMYDAGVRYTEPTIPLRPDTWIAEVIRSGTPFMLHRTEKELELPVDRALGNTQRKSASILLVPLWLGERVFGILSIQSYTLNAYSSEIADILVGIGQQVAIAIENARLFSGLQQELTERKQVELALRESEARLKAVIDQFPYDLWVCDAEGRYLLQNRAGEKTFPGLLGKTPLEYAGTPLELRQRWNAEHQQALRGEIFHSGLIEEVVDNQLHSFIVTVAPIVVDARVIGLVGLSVDVSELRQAEAAVRQLNDELEQRVAERTEQLEAANKELETFSYSVSHDLRAPLRSIGGFARIIAHDFGHQLDPQGQVFLDKIIAAAKEMNELIDSLLTISRLNQTELRRVTVDLSVLAADILTQLQHTEPTRAVTCRVTEGAFVNADAVLMRNVLENLLGNAWKYSSKTAQAEIEFGVLVNDNKTIYFVRDNGAGFDMKYADKLFGAFTRLHGANEFPGHGIGLATVQRIIHRHGGQIWADAAVDKGATFYFTVGVDTTSSHSQ